MRTFFYPCIFLLLLLNDASAQVRRVQTINSHWKFLKGNVKEARNADFEDESWAVVNVPHTWNALDVLADGERVSQDASS
jgi:beta-galactosidase